MFVGVKPLMPKIAEKIKNECQAGTFVMSYRFLIPCSQINENECEIKIKRTELHTEEDQGILDASLVYDQDEMRIYQLSSTKSNK